MKRILSVFKSTQVVFTKSHNKLFSKKVNMSSKSMMISAFKDDKVVEEKFGRKVNV